MLRTLTSDESLVPVQYTIVMELVRNFTNITNPTANTVKH